MRFVSGLVGEIEPNMIRVYDTDGFPRFEIFQKGDETEEDLRKFTDSVVEALNYYK